MFKEAIQEVVDGVEGGIAGLLMGFDGIPVDRYVADSGSIDVDTVGMEYSVILKDIRKAAQMLEAGSAREVSIKAENLTTVIRMLTDEYFLAVTLKPEGNLGKARYLLRTKGSALVSALS